MIALRDRLPSGGGYEARLPLRQLGRPDTALYAYTHAPAEPRAHHRYP